MGFHRTTAAHVTFALVAVVSCSKSASPPAAGDGGSDALGDVGLGACPVTAAGAAGDAGGDGGGGPTGDADDFGPNAKAVASSSALGQIDVYEVTTARTLAWVDLYLRADLAGTRVTISVYEASARNATFHRLAMIQLDVPPCVGWVGSGPLALSLEPGRFYAIGYDPNQAITAFVDSEANDLPIDGHFGRLIGSKTSTSVSLDTLDWGPPSDKSFTRQRLFTLPRAVPDGGTAADSGAADAPGAGDSGADRGAASDAPDATRG